MSQEISQTMDWFESYDTFDAYDLNTSGTTNTSNSETTNTSIFGTNMSSYGGPNVSYSLTDTVEDLYRANERNKYCTPRSQFTVESIPLTVELNGFSVPGNHNIWSTNYKNDLPLNGDSPSSSIASPPLRATSFPYHRNSVSSTTGANMYTMNIETQQSTQVGPSLTQVGPPLPQWGPPVMAAKKDFWFKTYTGNKITVNSNCRFFVIKSYNIIDVNASFINGIWASTELGNKRLSKAFKATKANGGDIYLFFSVNSSGKFSGICKMTSDVDFTQSSDIWSEVSKWKGIFQLEWLLIKDIPNKYFQNMKIPSNENKPVTNSRDTQEIPFEIAISMLKVFNSFKTTKSFLIQ